MKATTRLASVAALLLSAVTASAQWSANVGWSSEYIFRGIQQKTSSASAGLDFEQGGFYAGTWAADVGDGLEVDGYFGFGGGTDVVSYSVGFTGYYYTGDFDDTYQEINLGLAGGIFSVDVAVGEYENFSGPTQDYTFWSVSAEKDGFYGTLGGFAQDFEGEYLEVGYGTTVLEDIDIGIALVLANDDLVGDEDETLVFSIGKSFEL